MTLPVTTTADLLFVDRVVDEARTMDGVWYPSREGAVFLFPNDTPADALAMERDDWSCELFAYRCWVRALVASGGTAPPESLEPYHPQQGIIARWLPELGDAYGARETRETHRPLAPPEPGDVVLMLHGVSPHASVITGADGATTTSIDGGQTDPEDGARKGICARRRVYTVEGGALVVRPEGVLSPPAPVLWILRAALVQV